MLLFKHARSVPLPSCVKPALRGDVRRRTYRALGKTAVERLDNFGIGEVEILRDTQAGKTI